VVARYGSVVDIELFVAGYTDTVGSTASNQGLSERRAEAIAGWFARRGFAGPIWYQGFGESVLKRATPDETDELVNRRALYLLAAEVPPPSAELPHRNWRKAK
jgi:outer membrane protein OmpA-like peptidoglycan-associated protein